MTFGCAAAHGYNGKAAIPISRLFRTSETQSVPGIYNNRIEFWIERVLYDLLLVNGQQYLVAPDPELKRVIYTQHNFEKNKYHNEEIEEVEEFPA